MAAIRNLARGADHGVVYHRIHASSEPVAVTDRRVLDRLIEGDRSVVDRFMRFCQDERALDVYDEPRGWMSLFFWPYPLGLIDRTPRHDMGGLPQS